VRYLPDYSKKEREGEEAWIADKDLIVLSDVKAMEEEASEI